MTSVREIALRAQREAAPALGDRWLQLVGELIDDGEEGVALEICIDVAFHNDLPLSGELVALAREVLDGTDQEYLIDQVQIAA